MLTAYLACAAIAFLAGAVALWPQRRSPCRICLVTALAVIVGGSLLAYHDLGAARLLGPIAASEAMNDDMRVRLRGHMAELLARPEDPAGWRSFGRDLMIGGRYGEAATAYEQAWSHGGGDPLLHDVLTARFLASGGTVDDAAAGWLDKAEAAFPDHPKTRYFRALRRKALGRDAEALGGLRALATELPPADPLAVLVAEQIARLAGRSPMAP